MYMEDFTEMLKQEMDSLDDVSSEQGQALRRNLGIEELDGENIKLNSKLEEKEVEMLNLEEMNKNQIDNSNLPAQYNNSVRNKFKNFFGNLFNRNKNNDYKEYIQEMNENVENSNSINDNKLEEKDSMDFKEEMQLKVVSNDEIEKEIPIKNEYERILNKKRVNHVIDDSRRARIFGACMLGVGLVGLCIAQSQGQVEASQIFANLSPDEIEHLANLQSTALQSFDSFKECLSYLGEYLPKFSPSTYATGLSSLCLSVMGSRAVSRYSGRIFRARRELKDMEETEKELESR